MKKETLFKQIFEKNKPIIGIIHVFDEDKSYQLIQALQDLEILQRYTDGVIVENYGCGYFNANFATREMAETLYKITAAVVRKAKIPVGVNVLPNDYEYAFRIARQAGARFVQMDHITGEFVGCRSVNPKEFSAFRNCYPRIALLGGIHPKYYELADPDKSIADSAMDAIGLCDAIVVTGEYTGGAASLKDLELVKLVAGDYPVLVGSGLSAKNVKEQFVIADGAIIGTAFKAHGVQPNEPVDEDLVVELMNEVEKIRKI